MILDIDLPYLKLQDTKHQSDQGRIITSAKPFQINDYKNQVIEGINTEQFKKWQEILTTKMKTGEITNTDYITLVNFDQEFTKIRLNAEKYLKTKKNSQTTHGHLLLLRHTLKFSIGLQYDGHSKVNGIAPTIFTKSTRN